MSRADTINTSLTSGKCYYIDDESSSISEEGIQASKDEMVNHPPHYTWLKELVGIEVIDIVRHLDFDLGCAVKYILRQGRKSEKGMSDKEKAVEDLRKAIWYIEDRIKMIIKSD